MDSLLLNLLSSLGLSGAAGLNAYVPLLLIGVLDRLGYVNLASSYDWLSSPAALGVIGVVALADFVGDKVPGVDHVLHTVGGWINPVAGALVFAAQSGAVDVNPVLLMIAGFVVAGGFHATRTAVRPVATATTAGLGNPVVSFTEDVTSLGLSLLSVFAPLVGVALFAALAWLVFWFWLGLRRRRRRV